MLVKNLDIAEIRATNLNHQHKKATLSITFTNDTPLTREVTLQKNTEPIADSLLTWIKAQKRPNDDPNEDILSGVIIVNIVNDEDLRDKIAHELYRLYQKLDTVNHISTAREYMQTYNQLKTAHELVYQKKNA